MVLNDNSCARCDAQFSKLKSRRKKFNLAQIAGNHDRFQMKGNFVCQGCRNVLKRENYNSTTDTSDTSFNSSSNSTSALNLTSNSVQTDDTDLIFTPLKSPSKKRIYSTPLRRTPKKPKPLNRPIKSRKSFKEQTILHIQNSRYEKALTTMYTSNNRTAKQAIIQCASKIVSLELKSICLRGKDNSNSLCNDFNTESLDTFSWEDVCSKLQKTIPLTLKVLHSLFPDPKEVSKKCTVGKRNAKRYKLSRKMRIDKKLVLRDIFIQPIKRYKAIYLMLTNY